MTAEGGLIIPGQRLRDAVGLTKWLQVFLSCWMGVALVGLVLHYAFLRFFENIQQGVYSSRSAAIQDALLLDGYNRFLSIGRLTFLVITGILFLKWVYRANENARRLGAVDLEFTPRQAVGSYFIPIANLALPYQAMREIWNASVNPTDWQSMKGHPIVRSWWGLFLASNVISWVLLFNFFQPSANVAASILSTQLRLISDASTIAAGVAALLLVTRLRAIQIARSSSDEPKPQRLSPS
jgi:hypothetical protein